MFGSHLKHISRTNMLCYPVSKFMCRSQYKSILEHVLITFQAHFKNKHVVLPSFQIHVPITCKAILEHVWITFQAHFKNKHVVLPSFQIHVPMKCKAILERVWIIFKAPLKKEHTASPSLNYMFQSHVKQLIIDLKVLERCTKNILAFK
jgi:hypothetical protein